MAGTYKQFSDRKDGPRAGSTQLAQWLIKNSWATLVRRAYSSTRWPRRGLAVASHPNLRCSRVSFAVTAVYYQFWWDADCRASGGTIRFQESPSRQGFLSRNRRPAELKLLRSTDSFCRDLKTFCMILFMGTGIRIDSVMRPRSSSRGRKCPS